MQGKIGIKILLLSITFLCACLTSFTQDDLRVFGAVKDIETNKKMASTLVQVEQDGKIFDSFTTGGNARFEFELPLGYNYKFIFSKGGFTTKNIEISTKNIPSEDQEGGFDPRIDIALFKEIEGFDKSILENPMGIMSYDPNKNSLEWDFEYTKQMQQKVQAELQRLENNENTVDLSQQQFDELMIKGSDNLTKEKYDRAIENYTAALDIFPDDSNAQAKLEEAERLLVAQNAAAENLKAYERAMQLGESAMSSSDYALARTQFVEAKSLMPSRPEPKDRLRELDKLEEGADAQKKFDEFISAGDSDMNSEEYQGALDNYKEARDIFPADKDVKKKIDEAQSKLDEFLASQSADAAKEAQYQAFLDKGNGAFEEEKYERAIDYFEQALDIKDETYPKERIEQAQQRLNELKEQEENATAAAEANADDEAYNSLVKEADDLFISEDLEASRAKYSEAADKRPGEKYPRNRINKIDDILADNERQADEAKNKEVEDKEAGERLAALELEKEKQKALDQERQRALELEREEQDRLAQEEAQRKTDADKRRRTLTSNIDPNKERQAEEYYAQEKESTEKEAQTSIEKIKTDHYQNLYDKNEKYKFDARKTSQELDEVKSDVTDLAAAGQNYQNDKNSSFERKEEKVKESNQQLALEADNRRKDDLYEIEKLKESQKEATVHLSEFEENVVESKQQKTDLAQVQKSYVQQGEIFRKDKQYDIADAKKEIIEMADDGEVERQKSQDKIDQAKNEITRLSKENVSLQNDRIDDSLNSTDRLKISQKEAVLEGEKMNSGNVETVNFQKESRGDMLASKSSQSEIERDLAREKAFDVNRGQPKDFDDYKVVPGTEELAEGVTERSYEINNGSKLVIERTLKIGNKVVTYSKVIAKYGIYYFQDSKSITKTTWERDTLRLVD